jgi:hypothetical protein
VCKEPLPDGAKACPVCGTSVAGTLAGEVDASPGALDLLLERVNPETTLQGERECPDCGARYGPEYADAFCRCGSELVAASGAAPRPAPDVLPFRPPAGTVCLVLYSADRAPLHYHPLDRDVTRIGRTDAVRGDFPDLDLGKFFDEATARKVSRKHALVLRSRVTNAFVLRPLAQNTGTQIESELARELQDYPLREGTRIILGGTVRMKFEVVK